MRMDRSRYALALLSTVIWLLPSGRAPLADAKESAVTATGGQKAAPEFALRGQRDAHAITYDNWQKFCFQTPGSAKVCRTTISGKWATGQSAIRIDLIERDGEHAERLQLFLPVGLYLQAGVKLSVDQGGPVAIPYVWCLTNTCIAGDRANPTLILQMETGQQLKLEVTDTNLLSVSTTIPLGTFAAAHAGAPSHTYEQNVDE
jgi:invasion protein IalB